MNKKIQRNSNLEILRIIAMIFIIAHHFAMHGMNGVNLISANPNNYLIYFSGILGKIGVNLFVLISAYFMIDSNFTFRKFLVLGGEVYFYALLFLLIFVEFITPPNPLTVMDMGIPFLPISHSAYWFVTDYIVLMILSPFLNKFIKSLSKSSFIKLLSLILIIWCVFPSITPTFIDGPVTTMFAGYSFQYVPIIWFIILYFIGSFIKLHINIDKFSFKKLILAFSISMIITYIVACIIGYYDIILPADKNLHMWLGYPIEGLYDNRLFMWPALENKIFLFIGSLGLFMIFLKRKEFSNKYINYIAGSAFGVYLIHDNLLVRPYLWNNLLHVPSYYFSPYFFIFMIGSIFGVYIVCTGIDIVRRLTVEKLWIWIIDNKLNSFWPSIVKKYNSFEIYLDNYLK